jgi:hypothetical protein
MWDCVETENSCSHREPNGASHGLLLSSPPTLRRGFNGFCTSTEEMMCSGAKARRPLRQAQGGLNQLDASAVPLTIHTVPT